MSEDPRHAVTGARERAEAARRPAGAGVSGGREVAAARGPVGYALAQATKAHRVELQRRLARLGLHLGQELLVVDLHHNPGTTQAELVQRIGIEQPTMAKVLTRMERAGFVQRAPDPDDRRVTRLELTERGTAAVDAVQAIWAELDAQAAAGLGEDDARRLIRLLNTVRDNLA
ncbi:MarR family transcriptional regulator [Sphaerisporangium sp. TRM90804]|uniref:MarR family winged helix-turn-helix transcriptional regulator n=1 Tax=Sphaerisporangium sp. TRM90804 TaxID=3031113 RepID=UPI00244B925C|nr:MarR family transcriptional regulator [Sphaerisporangium sp. TRM90804]MDH2428909.1 MarR family transcriptional regulator [Sphaerisporangium sp. TRM90804]